MGAKLRIVIAIVFGVASMSPSVHAEESLHQADSSQLVEEAAQVILQIGGRFCEYHRDEIEAALRRYPAVHDVEFLNDHGTVLVRYKANGVLSAQLAESAARAAFGMGCTAWVDRGGSAEGKS